VSQKKGGHPEIDGLLNGKSMKIHPIKMDENWGNYLYFGKPPYQWSKLMI
jgi:hypothetical protein